MQWFHIFFTSTVSYILLVALPPSLSVFFVPVFAMTYCVLGHLHRQYVNYLGWDLDFTGCMMIVTIKLWMIAFNISDGDKIKRARKSKKEGKKEDFNDFNVPKAVAACKEFALETVPGPLEFYGYLFNFSTVLAGPAFEYRIYEAACSGELFKTPAGGTKYPSNLWPTLKALLTSVTCMIIYITANPQFPLTDPADPQNATPVLLAAMSVDAVGIGVHWAYIMVACMANRFKYYFAWKCAEGACNAW